MSQRRRSRLRSSREAFDEPGPVVPPCLSGAAEVGLGREQTFRPARAKVRKPNNAAGQVFASGGQLLVELGCSNASVGAWACWKVSHPLSGLTASDSRYG